MADSTVIVQHVCSVAIFVCCFVGIFQERVSPVSVVSWGSALTVLGWVLWDFWVGQEQAARSLLESSYAYNAINESPPGEGHTAGAVPSTANSSDNGQSQGLGLIFGNNGLSLPHSRNPSATSIQSASSIPSQISGHPTGAPQFANYSHYPPYNAPASPFSLRTQQRLATAKSAILIYCALLGLSPILKSLTKSTTSDSIWAMSCWLMCINIFFFDYGGGVGVKYVLLLKHA